MVFDFLNRQRSIEARFKAKILEETKGIYYQKHTMPVPIEKSAIPCYNQKNHRSHQEMNKFCERQDTIPPTAKAIKIGNVQNPYIMRAYIIEKHKETLYRIQEKLLNVMKTNEFLKKEDKKDAKVDDMVLMQYSHKAGIKLPSFVCRGLITYIKKETETYSILLLDHGTSIELTRDKFYILPQDIIPDKHLTKTVGVYGILPICMRKNGIVSSGSDSNASDSNASVSNGSVSSGSNAMAVVVEKWTKEAIQFTKRLLSASESVYFDHLITDKSNGRQYGEFYFIIDNIVMSLSEALFINYHALYIEGELLKLVETYTQLKEKRWYILHVKFSRNREKKNNAARINGINNSRTKFCLSEKILIQSTIDCDVLSDITDLRYPRGIHEGWNGWIKSSRPRKLQSYIWPAINNGLNVVAIGSLQCGKTTGCVMAVCGQIARRQNEIHSATRPLALILCASSFEVIYIQSLCQTFLQSFNNIRSVAAFNGKSDRSVAATIYSGCQILVTTPRYLVRFLNENKGLLSFDRLSCLVLDNADVILDKYYNSLGELFKKHKIIENREPRDDRPILQIIISATNWTNHINKFVHLAMYNPYICIASFIEAVIFKSVRPKLYGLNSMCKNKEMSDLLKDNYTTVRTAIICINAEEADKLNAVLFLTKKTLLIHEKMESFEIRALRENWKACVCGSYPVLICTDPVLSDLNLTNIQWLIHHSVLLKFKTRFNYRFSVLLDNLTQDATNCKISIFIDENNDIQLQGLIKILQRMNAVISSEMLDKMQRIAITLERVKKEYALCDNVKSFGFCQTQNVCVFRHCVLPEIDAPMINIRVNDKVKLVVICVHNTTHFSARIIEHIPHSEDSKKITYSNIEYMQTTAKIQNYFSNIENRKMCTSTNVGDICVLEETIDTFKRVQIRRIRYDRNYSEEVKFVEVRCIDSGVIHECIDVRKLMHIPEELLNLPTHLVEIFLADLMPKDEEYMWNHYTNEQVHKWFLENFDERSYIIGKVRLHLGNTIWLHDLRIGTKLIGYPDLIGSSLKKELLYGNFTVLNNDHISNLFKLCKNSGLTEINGHDTSIICK